MLELLFRLLRHAPDARLGLKVGDVTRVVVLLIARPFGLLGRSVRQSSIGAGLRRRGRRRTGFLKAVADLLLPDYIGDLSSLSEEVEILSNRAGVEAATKRVIVERILVIVQLVSQAVVRILKVDAIVIKEKATGQRYAPRVVSIEFIEAK